MTTATLTREAEAIETLRDRANALMPVPADPSFAFWEAPDGTLRTLPDITDHEAVSAATAVLAWSGNEIDDLESAHHLRVALEHLVERLEARKGMFGMVTGVAVQ
jgi:hypothetical protein